MTDFIICQKERWLLIGLKWENMHFELTFGGGKSLKLNCIIIVTKGGVKRE